MLKKVLTFFIAASLLAILSGCTHRITDFTIISTKNVDLSSAGKFKRAKGRIKGVDTQHMLVFIPLGAFPSMKEAIDDAIEQVPGAVALVDGVVYFKAFWLVIYGQRQYIIEGTPLIDPKLASKKYDTPYLVARYDHDAKQYNVTSVSEAEYVKLKSELTDS